MRRFRVIVHIGTVKTGTTTLQKWLYHNKNILQHRHGIYYVTPSDSINSRHIAAACVDIRQNDEYLSKHNVLSQYQFQCFTREVTERLSQEIYDLPLKVHTILLSCEQFHTRLTSIEKIELLKEMLLPFASSFEIICYLRRQVDMATSLYSTYLRAGGTAQFDVWIKGQLMNMTHKYDYNLLLEKWASVFSESAIRSRIFRACCV